MCTYTILFAVNYRNGMSTTNHLLLQKIKGPGRNSLFFRTGMVTVDLNPCLNHAMNMYKGSGGKVPRILKLALVASFMLQPLFALGERPRYPVDKRTTLLPYL
jgi:hypothetical protein